MGSGSLDSDSKKGKEWGVGKTERIRSLGQGRPGKEDTKINIKMKKSKAELLNLYLTFLV